MDYEKIPENLIGTKNQIVELQELSKELGTSMMGLCLSYLELIKFASSCVVGVASKAQLQEIMSAGLVNISQRNLPSRLPPHLADPRNWKSSK
jgi:aryl-alcohol dehydrogenase-like predicted oxidoreductase